MADEFSTLNDNLNTLARNLVVVDNHVSAVDYKVDAATVKIGEVETNLDQLIKEFLDFVAVSEGRFNIADAKQNLIQINQEISRLFGHYDEIRRMTTGILQATDLGIIRGETMVSLTEEVTVKTPGYWLAPALLALTAWINDDRTTAEKALNEALNRDNEKTSLLFTLICRRANRPLAGMKWLHRFLDCQDPDRINHKVIVMLDAYVSGILGLDSEGEVSSKLNEWIEHIVNETNFDQKYIDLWQAAIENLIGSEDLSEWKFLKENSDCWPQIEDSLNYLELHEYLYNYFESVFEEEQDQSPLKVQLDRTLDDLVTNYDAEELPLRKEKRYNELIVECGGDKELVDKQMDVEKETYEEFTDFATVLSEVSMNPDSRNTSPNLQKYSIAMCKDWILSAYRNVVVTHENKIPSKIGLEVEVKVNSHPHTFVDETRKGDNEREAVANYLEFMEDVRKKELALTNHSIGEYIKIAIGLILSVLGLIYVIDGSLMGLLLGLPGLFILYKGIKSYVWTINLRKNVDLQCDDLIVNGLIVVRGFFAEVVDYRRLIVQKGQGFNVVEEYLSGLQLDQYVANLDVNIRRIPSQQ